MKKYMQINLKFRWNENVYFLKVQFTKNYIRKKKTKDLNNPKSTKEIQSSM